MVVSSNSSGGILNRSGVSQVSLVHASDSIRAISGQRSQSVNNGTSQSSAMMTTTHNVPSTSSSPFFSVMSKPPVRMMPTPGGQAAHHHHHQYQIPTMSVQPMAGRTHSEFIGTYIKRPTTVAVPSATVTQQVKQNSQEMLQKVRAVRRQVADEETELRRLREMEQETAHLAARNAGRERDLATETARLNEHQQALRSATMRVQSLTKHLEEMYKRRQTAAAAALVEHRKLQQHQLLQQQQLQHQQQQRVTSSSAAVAAEIIRPRASVEPFQVILQSEKFEETGIPNSKINDDDQQKDQGTDAVDSATNKIPSEPSYLAPSPPTKSRDDVITTIDADQQKRPPCLSTFAPSAVPAEKGAGPAQTISFGESLDESKLRSGKTDLISLRSDSLKATKRRSWAASEGTSMSEAEMIHRMLDEQRRGRSHFIPQLPTPQEEEPSMTMIGGDPIQTVSPPIPPQPSEAQSQKLKLDEMEEDQNKGDDTTTEEEEEDGMSSSGASSPKILHDQQKNQKDPERKVKGILRRPNQKMNKGRIEFDPLALLLDAALEGELDLVKSSAAKLVDVSQANDEGITALHNAICAGHYEIVRFLIEHDADVNAQDSDGWTPLHCAASCNNLPMVRQLVEGGGCVLASTLSDMETPVEKCEEEEDGYDGCLKYLVAAHNATGALNNGKVYAAYSFEAEHEDELSFEWGDELVVLSKDDVDKNWWTCRKRGEDGETGLVPRTYLALYPALKFRKQLNFVMFDLPLESNNNIE